MRILVTNDDGVDAPGLRVAEAIAAGLSDDVWTVAPSSNRSGTGQSVSLHEPLACIQQGPKQYVLPGTPADCVMYGVGHLLRDTPPDVVFSGVNHGANLSDSIMYSGTIGAVLAAEHLGIAGVALSQAYRGERIDFEPSRRWARTALHTLWAQQDAVRCWSINFPATLGDTAPCLRIVREARLPVSQPRWIADRDAQDPRQQRLTFAYDSRHVTDPDRDIAALRNGRVAAMALRGARSDPNIPGPSAAFEWPMRG
ncbi:5'/3'-nucleotidase SurE [Salinisphaera sp. SPP-AMP-43]|uniref:5'/3'-nucleotidase SurE n=1 Tax=Salinisphaera sp. SPP-AMP-43 TaxID=3121288 RepID=UPI003C6E65E3